jgi:hypothetical protein
LGSDVHASARDLDTAPAETRCDVRDDRLSNEGFPHPIRDVRDLAISPIRDVSKRPNRLPTLRFRVVGRR